MHGEVVVERGPGRDEWRALLELADEPEPLRRYLNEGACYGLRDPETQRLRAAVLVIDLGAGAAELRAVAVAEDARGRGLGSWIVGEVCARLRAAGVGRVVVGTASSGTRQLAFYQRLGFRLTHIERDFFTTERGYPPGLSENGIPNA